MRQFAFVVVGAMLVAAPGTGNAAQRSDRLDALRQIATGIGSVSGAASVCREISWPRMKALTDKFADLLKTSVTDNGEYSSIQQAYDQSSMEGQLTVTSKQVDCGAAVRDLADLERAVALQPPAAVTMGASPPAAQVTTGAALPSSRHLPSMASAPSNMFTTVATTGAAWWCWRQSRRPAQVSSISQQRPCDRSTRRRADPYPGHGEPESHVARIASRGSRRRLAAPQLHREMSAGRRDRAAADTPLCDPRYGIGARSRGGDFACRLHPSNFRGARGPKSLCMAPQVPRQFFPVRPARFPAMRPNTEPAISPDPPG
jgi:hypothetical protein